MQLLTTGLHFLIQSLQLLVRRLHVFDDRVKVLACIRKLTLNYLNVLTRHRVLNDRSRYDLIQRLKTEQLHGVTGYRVFNRYNTAP